MTAPGMYTLFRCTRLGEIKDAKCCAAAGELGLLIVFVYSCTVLDLFLKPRAFILHSFVALFSRLTGLELAQLCHTSCARLNSLAGATGLVLPHCGWQRIAGAHAAF